MHITRTNIKNMQNIPLPFRVKISYVTFSFFFIFPDTGCTKDHAKNRKGMIPHAKVSGKCRMAIFNISLCIKEGRL